MASALFTALALIAAGQGGSVPSPPAEAQMRSSGMSEARTPLQLNRRVATAERRRNG